MAFSSVQFLFVFLPLSLAVYWLCPKWLRNAVLAAFSLLFFAWAEMCIRDSPIATRPNSRFTERF